MTVYIQFDKFFKFYRDSYHGKNEVYKIFEDQDFARGAKWLYSIESEIESNIYISITSNCCNHYFYSPNVDVIYDGDNDIVINGEKSQNSIYLKVSINQLPKNIDSAIEYYKNSIVDLLVNNFGSMENIEDDGFADSKFREFCDKNTYFIKQWNCIDNNILGLWCWDMVKDDGYTVAEAAEKISKSIVNNKLAAYPYKETSIEEYYDRISSILSFKIGKKKKATLDKFVTGSNSIILGLRAK